MTQAQSNEKKPASAERPPSKRVTTQRIADMKSRGVKVSMVTAYDYMFAKLFDEAGIDMLLVGDSVSNVIQGNETTLPVTLDEMIYHAKMVFRGAEHRSMVICDMPFMSYQVNAEEGFRNAGRIMKETGVGAVKVEGGERVCPLVRMVSEAGIPVMGHLGLTPQSIHQFGSYRTRGTSDDEAKRIMKDAKALQEAGAFAIVLEKIPTSLAEQVTKELEISTIGIGAGPHCDGQVLVMHDMLGLTEEFSPRFVRRYAHMAEDVRSAARQFNTDIKNSSFPSANESY